MTPIYMISSGAVTPVGLDSFSTCAAVRARVSRISEVFQRPPPAEAICGCQIKAGRALRRTERDWLLNMAAKALSECAAGLSPNAATALILFPPEPQREHPGMLELSHSALLETLAQRAGLYLAAESEALDTGAGALMGAIAQASALLHSRKVTQVVVGGFDSLLNRVDMARLEASNRLRMKGNPQGVIPGEGAAFVAFSASASKSPFAPLATVTSAASVDEQAVVTGSDYSVGRAFGAALSAALSATEGKLSEPSLDFICSNDNGERYAAWESVFHHTRSFRSRRELLSINYPAMSFGDLGSASSAVCLIVAAVALARGYAPGARGVVEARSEGPARGVAILEAAPNGPAFSAPGERRSM